MDKVDPRREKRETKMIKVRRGMLAICLPDLLWAHLMTNSCVYVGFYRVIVRCITGANGKAEGYPNTFELSSFCESWLI